MQELIEAAKIAAKNSHSPYSKYKVGCAVLTESGEIYSGCNIENASYSAGICAERTAAAKAIASGARKLKAIAVYADSDILPLPCGVCLQFLSEFASGDLAVFLSSNSGQKQYKFSELMPMPFKLS